jgi:hypothetical protein
MNVTPFDFDMELAATLARFIDEGFGPAALEAVAEYLQADAEMTAALRQARMPVAVPVECAA